MRTTPTPDARHARRGGATARHLGVLLCCSIAIYDGGSIGSAIAILADSGARARVPPRRVCMPAPFRSTDCPPGSGEIWVDFGAMAILSRFQLPPSEQMRLTVLIPNAPVLRGLAITVQALTASVPAGFYFSTPATSILN